MQNPIDLTSLLVFLAGGGAAALLAPLLAKLDFFVALPDTTKVTIVAVLNMLIAAGAYLIQQSLTPEQVTMLNPLVMVLLNALYMVINQLTFAAWRSRQPQAV